MEPWISRYRWIDYFLIGLLVSMGWVLGSAIMMAILATLSSRL